MIVLKVKAWRTVGAAAALGLAACGQSGDAGRAAGAGSNSGDSDAALPAPAETIAASSGGGESGEAGATSAFAGLSGDQLTALRLQHLEGFVMAAERVNAANMPAEAAVIVHQGLLEAYEGAPAEFGSMNAAPLRAVADGATLTQAQMAALLRTAEAELDRASSRLHADGAVTTARMVDVATGLYQNVVQADVVDPIEYQHSMGAAFAAQAALAAHRAELQRRDRRAYGEAQAALADFVALWPQTAAPEHPTAYREVLAQGSRVRLALSPYL